MICATIWISFGRFVSQFMLAGNNSIPRTGDGATNTKEHEALYRENDSSPKCGIPSDTDETNGYILYGNQFIDQRQRTFLNGLDYMTSWPQWLDVQNGADMRGQRVFEKVPPFRYNTTPLERHGAEPGSG